MDRTERFYKIREMLRQRKVVSFAQLQSEHEVSRSTLKRDIDSLSTRLHSPIAWTRGLYVFKHDSKLGNAPAHSLFDRLEVKPKEADAVARSFDAYSVKFDGKILDVGQEVRLEPGVTLTRRC